MQRSEIFILDRDGNKLFEDDQYFQEMYWISDDKLFFGQDIYVGTKGYVLDIQDFQYISELTEPVSIKMDSNGILYTYNYKEDTLRIYTDISALQYKEYNLSERRMSDLEIYLYKDIIYEPRTDREGRFFLYKIPCSEIDN